ncbi:hypothetical protein [Streptomyces sp. MP131-18]|uniref:hypothetical protein n=1 Tax=Streptomyces sp. MP131-18 TaxID=1857892 RepID=UPI0009D1F79D|nr:hypothetical protein [Streptomyces sp. MP131-18]ONK11322.1 hypothetical protein STBA_20530 [Streptomyces sp. MP131-18]
MSGTRGLLWRRLAALLVLTATATALLFAAYADQQRRPGAVRDRIAPAILEVTAARTALMTGHLAADRELSRGISGVVGSGEEYRAQLAAATQSLAQSADPAGLVGAGELRDTVNALLMAYDRAMGLAVAHEDNEPVRGAWFLSADALLNREDSGILARLQELQDRQLARLAQETELSTGRRAVWLLAAAAALALAALLAVTLRQLARRFPARLDPFLLAACLIVLAAWLPLLPARAAHDRLDAAADGLTGLVAMQRDATTDDRDSAEWTDWLAAVQTRTTAASDGVESGTDRPAPAAATLPAIAAGGAAVAALCTGGLFLRLRDYERFQS